MKSQSQFGIQERETDISPWRSREMCVFLTVKLLLLSIVENLNMKNFSSLVCEECEMCVRKRGTGDRKSIGESNKMKRLKESRMEA